MMGHSMVIVKTILIPISLLLGVELPGRLDQ